MNANGDSRILGIDPGLRVTGYAVLEPGPRVCEAGVIRSSEGRAAPDMGTGWRLG
jgi:crossover junction endodeoxyribonuclease RuvC